MSKPLSKIYIFVDESYLLGCSAKLQCALPVSSDSYEGAIKDLHRRELFMLGALSNEFKGNRLTRGNKDIYLNFLKGFIRHSIALSDGSSIRPLVSLDANASYKAELDLAMNIACETLYELNISIAPKFIKEFVLQVLWLARYLHYVVPETSKHAIIVIFDDRYEYADICHKQIVLTSNNYPGRSRRINTWELLTSLANKMLILIRPDIKFPLLNEMNSRKSHKECGLQAADIIVNSFYGALRYELGLINEASALRYQLVRIFLNTPLLTPDLAKCLRLVNSDLECLDSELASKFTFVPS